MAAYSDEDGLSGIYVYITPQEDFPDPNDNQITSISRTHEITVDYHRTTGQLLGIEILTPTREREGEKLS